jgi:hypothetical protein
MAGVRVADVRGGNRHLIVIPNRGITDGTVHVSVVDFIFESEQHYFL